MKISAVVLNKNEEEVIRDCLESLKWVDEIIVLDGGSTDKSLGIAKEYKTRIMKQKGKDFAAWRTEGLRAANREWILYVDPDERITPLLKNEIEYAISNKKYAAYAIPRRNFLLGKELRFGGWSPDYVKRLFFRANLKRWQGELHEEPVFKGNLGHLTNAMIHFQPEKIEPALEKSIKWSDIEAKLLFEASHPPVTWWRVLRMGATTLFDRLIKKQGFRDGPEGWIESIYQSFHTMIIYVRLWEMQNKRD